MSVAEKHARPQPESAAARKLEAEIVLIEKQAAKLDAELRGLAAPKPAPPVWRSLTWWRDLIAIFSAVATLYYGVHTFLAQRAAEQQLEVTREVIVLVEQLRSPRPRERETAAVLLSAYGEKALPILLNSVKAERSTGASSLAAALLLIGRDNAAAVLAPLRQQASALFTEVIAGDEESVDALLAHLTLLGELAVLGDRDASERLLAGFAADLDCEQVAAATTLPISEVDRRALCAYAARSLSELAPSRSTAESPP